VTTIHEAVAAKIHGQREHKEVLALWDSLWAAYEKNGADGVERVLLDLIKSPGEDEAESGAVEEEG
jgi:hypothetical protein